MVDPNAVQVALSTETLNEVGKVMVEELSRAAAKEFTRRKWSFWATDGRTKITDSFKYKIVGGTGIELSTSFQGIENFVSGTPISRDSEGNILLRKGAFRAGGLWFHPGIGQRNFLHVGIEKGKERVKEIMVREALREWAKGDPFK